MRIIAWDADDKGGILEIEKRSLTSSVFDAYNQATDFCTHQLRSANRALHLLAEVNRGFQGIEEWMPKGKVPESVTA